VGTSTAPFAGTLRRANRRSRVPSRPTPLPAPTMASACPQERTQERRPAWQARWRRPTPRAMTDPRPASRSWQGPSQGRQGPRPAAAWSTRPASKAMRMTKRTERTSFSWLSKSSTVLHGRLAAYLAERRLIVPSVGRRVRRITGQPDWLPHACLTRDYVTQ